MHICALDPEMEYEDLTNNLGGCFIDLMSGEFIINLWNRNLGRSGKPGGSGCTSEPFASGPDYPSISVS